MCNDTPDADMDELWFYEAAARINRKPADAQVTTFLGGVLDKFDNGKSVAEARRIAFTEWVNGR